MSADGVLIKYIYSICLMCHCKGNKIRLFGTVDETKLSLFLIDALKI